MPTKLSLHRYRFMNADDKAIIQQRIVALEERAPGISATQMSSELGFARDLIVKVLREHHDAEPPKVSAIIQPLLLEYHDLSSMSPEALGLTASERINLLIRAAEVLRKLIRECGGVHKVELLLADPNTTPPAPAATPTFGGDYAASC